MLVPICLAARGPDWAVPGGRLLARPVRWLAGCSYGIYLVHSSIGQLIAARLAQHGASSWQWLAIVLTTITVLGWALMVWVERPIYTWLTRRHDIPQPATAT